MRHSKNKEGKSGYPLLEERKGFKGGTIRHDDGQGRGGRQIHVRGEGGYQVCDRRDEKGAHGFLNCSPRYRKR